MHQHRYIIGVRVRIKHVAQAGGRAAESMRKSRSTSVDHRNSDAARLVPVHIGLRSMTEHVVSRSWRRNSIATRSITTTSAHEEAAACRALFNPGDEDLVPA